MNSNLLIIFAKNPEIGNVKTRLAKSIGDENALKVYLKLLEHTHRVADKVNASKKVYFNKVSKIDILDYYKFQKELQRGGDLGEKMRNAFLENYDFEKIVLIGSDCLEINEDIIEDAFLALEENDCVIGPANDGGYYLIGSRGERLLPIFRDKEWSTENVLLDTILDLKKHDLSYHLLEELSDIDEEKDLPVEWVKSMLQK
ncbi:MAG: glycosyltransferase [Flavobacteriales bacterium]|nr:glycosyltransferase [Flavobacteriales bacterium]